MMYYVKAELYAPGTEPLFVVHGPGLSEAGIAFIYKVDAESCAVACERVRTSPAARQSYQEVTS